MHAKPEIPEVVHTNGSYTGRLVLTDLANPKPHIETSLSNGMTVNVPVEELLTLGNIARQILHTSHSYIDQTRRAAHHPLWLDGYGDMLVAVETGDSRDFPTVLKLADAPESDTTALLIWSKITHGNLETTGWRLAMMGSRDMAIGVAPWDDEVAIKGLIAQMADSDSLQIIAGMVDPDRMGHLSSRMTARTLMEEKALKRITLTKVRKALADNGLATSDDLDRDARVLLRILSLQFGDKRLPLAAAIMAPSRAEAVTQEFNARSEEWEGKGYHIRETVRQEILTRFHEEWVQAVTQAIPQIGWRVLDLPNPDRGWRHRGCPVVWATPIPSETWSQVARAAEAEASRLSMGRGSPA